MTTGIYAEANGFGGRLQVDGADVLAWNEGGLNSGGILMNASRQCVQYGQIEAALGRPTFLSGGIAQASAASPLRVSFASGDQDYISIASANIAVQAAANVDAAYQVRSAYLDYVNETTMTGGVSKAPPQYGPAYVAKSQMALTFNGKATDEFGNVWTLGAGALSYVASTKFPGTQQAQFNGATYLSTPIDTLLNSSFSGVDWCMQGYFTFDTLASQQPVFAATNAAGYGAVMNLTTAGKLFCSISSNGTSNDVMTASTLSTTTLTTGTPYHIAFQYNSMWNGYEVWINGVRETALCLSGANRVCPLTQLLVGYDTTRYLTGKVQNFELLPYIRFADTSGSTVGPLPPLADLTRADYAADWFDTVNMRMYKVTGPSPGVGVPPSMTQVLRCYIGVLSYDGSGSPSTFATHPFNGFYASEVLSLSGGNVTIVNHNMGTHLYTCEVTQCDSTAGNNERPVALLGGGTYGIQVSTLNPRQATVLNCPTGLLNGSAGTAATGGVMLRVRLRRRF